MVLSNLPNALSLATFFAFSRVSKSSQTSSCRSTKASCEIRDCQSIQRRFNYSFKPTLVKTSSKRNRKLVFDALPRMHGNFAKRSGLSWVSFLARMETIRTLHIYDVRRTPVDPVYTASASDAVDVLDAQSATRRTFSACWIFLSATLNNANPAGVSCSTSMVKDCEDMIFCLSPCREFRVKKKEGGRGRRCHGPLLASHRARDLFPTFHSPILDLAGPVRLTSPPRCDRLPCVASRGGHGTSGRRGMPGT